MSPGEPVWPRAENVRLRRLVLEPLTVDHAEEMAPLLDDERLHHYVGGEPADLDELRDRYAVQAAGVSPDGSQGWLNWIMRLPATGEAVGYVQATLERDRHDLVADVAWVTALSHQGQGFAVEAALGMAAWLRGAGVTRLVAHVHPRHEASKAVARHLGLAPTDVVVDGETRWLG
jgi:RimJ/RimL family protein N-acetyltransferase